MHVYFVRHGETDLNRKYIHQSPNTPLSARGRDQVRTTAEELRQVNPDLLISSEYTRALESARIIGLTTGLTPVTNGLFYEVVRPSSFYGHSLFSPTTWWYACVSVLRRKQTVWRYADAENFADIDTRARKAIGFLESLHDQYASVIVVSHTVFISIILLALCKRWPPNARDLFFLLVQSRKMRNASVIHVEYLGQGADNTCSWRVIGRV